MLPVSKVTRPARILLVEDNLADIELLRIGLQQSGVSHHLHVVTDGEQAIDFMHKSGKYQAAPYPDLILLDLNLPRKTGMEVLSDLKGRAVLKRIPVVVITSSHSFNDVTAAYDGGANAYMRKPSTLDEILSLVRSIESYWLQNVTLPPMHRGWGANLVR